MNLTTNDKLSMYLQVHEHLHHNVTHYKSLQTVMNVKTELDANLAAIKHVMTRQAPDKNSRVSLERVGLELIMLKIVSALKTFTIDANKYLLNARVSYSLRELNALSDTELLAKAKKLLDIATPKIDRLAAYHITPAHLYDLHNQRDVFSRSISGNNDEHHVSLASIELESLLYATDNLLVALDHYMARLMPGHVLWRAYQAARGLDMNGKGMAHDYDAMSPRAAV